MRGCKNMTIFPSFVQRRYLFLLLNSPFAHLRLQHLVCSPKFCITIVFQLHFGIFGSGEWPLCMITSDEPITPPSLVCEQNSSHKGLWNSVSCSSCFYVVVVTVWLCYRLFTRILLDIPSLTDGAVMAVRMYCEDLVSNEIRRHILLKSSSRTCLPNHPCLGIFRPLVATLCFILCPKTPKQQES